MSNADLDRMMAERVMGWHEVKHGYCSYATGLPYDHPCWQDEDNEPTVFVSDWHPSSDIAQAFMCAEKAFDGKGFDLRMQPEGVWTVILEKDYWVTADTPAEAICLAIKKALEGN